MSPTSYQAAPPRDSALNLALFRSLVKQNPRGDERYDESHGKRLDEGDRRVHQRILVHLRELLRVSNLLVDFRLTLTARPRFLDRVRLILCREIGDQLVVDELPGRDIEDRSHHHNQHPHRKPTPEAYRPGGDVVSIRPNAEEDQQKSEDHRGVADDLGALEADAIDEWKGDQHHD